MTDNPVGTLIVEAEKKAQKKASKTHTSTAACGCQVEVAWFSANSRSTRINRCSEHPVRRVP